MLILLLLLVATTLAAQQPAWNVDTHTGPVRPLSFEATEGTWMSLDVSPDGRTIAFDLLGHIYEMPVEGGAARRLTQGRSWNMLPRYSPDGRSLAFTSDRSGNHGIWIMDRQGAGLRQVAGSLDEAVYKAVWSPDGRRLLVGTSYDGRPSQMVAVELAGGRQTVLTGAGTLNPAAVGSAGDVVFERGGRPVYPFEFNPYLIPDGGGSIERLDPATGEVTVLAQRPGGAFAPALSTDGRWLAFVNRDIDTNRLIIRNLETREERTLLRGLDLDRQASRSGYGPYPAIVWHPDGRRILLNRSGRIESLDVRTGAATPVPFRAAVERAMSETIRFPTREAETTARTRTHRWGSRTAQGVLFEALGDVWLQGPSGPARNLTRSAAFETSPVLDPAAGMLYYAAWTDDSLGAIHRVPLAGGNAERLTTVPAQYGSIAVKDGRMAYLRGADGLERGAWLSNEAEFDLMVREPDGSHRRITGVSSQPIVYADIAGKIPPAVVFGPDRTLYFTEFERDTLVLKRIGLDGTGETALVKFPNGVAAVPSPDLHWIALREYQRSFLVPLAYLGRPVVVSPWEGTGFAVRVDPEDGGYLTWSADSRVLGWTRATGFYEKDVDQIVAEARAGPRPVPTDAAAWNGPRVPGSTARRVETAVEFTVEVPGGVVALTGARVLTMNPGREVIDNATIIVRGSRIAAVGQGVPVPAGARVFDLAGATVMPGIIDAHAHPHIEHSMLHVIEQQPTYLSGPLAYGVTTVVEVYGNEYRDGWLSDMLRAGRMTGPRFFTTGSVIFGYRRALRARMFRPIATLADALEQLRWNKDHGAIAVKDYAQTTRLRRHLTVTAARILGLNVVSESNADPQANLTQLMDGVTGIEHTSGQAPFYDDVVRYWGGTTAGNTPTLLVVYNGAMGEGWYHQTGKLWEDPKLTRFIAPEQLMRIRSSTHLRAEDMFAWKMGAEVRKLFHNGNSVQLGAHGQMFGLDAHWELDLLGRSGFTPAEALEVATIRGAAYHGLDADLGSIETGKLADLVVLEANPLESLANAARIRYVMKNGVLYAGADAARVWPDPKPAGKPYFSGRQ